LSSPFRAAALVFVLLAASARACASSIELLPEAAIDGANVTLGEIAHVQGRDSAGTAALAAVSLGPAPHVGLERRVRRDDIVRALRARGWDKDDNVAYSGATVATVRAASRSVKADALTQCAGDALCCQRTQYRDDEGAGAIGFLEQWHRHDHDRSGIGSEAKHRLAPAGPVIMVDHPPAFIDWPWRWRSAPARRRFRASRRQPRHPRSGCRAAPPAR